MLYYFLGHQNSEDYQELQDSRIGARATKIAGCLFLVQGKMPKSIIGMGGGEGNTGALSSGHFAREKAWDMTLKSRTWNESIVRRATQCSAKRVKRRTSSTCIYPNKKNLTKKRRVVWSFFKV